MRGARVSVSVAPGRGNCSGEEEGSTGEPLGGWPQAHAGQPGPQHPPQDMAALVCLPFFRMRRIWEKRPPSPGFLQERPHSGQQTLLTLQLRHVLARTASNGSQGLLNSWCSGMPSTALGSEPPGEEAAGV